MKKNLLIFVALFFSLIGQAANQAALYVGQTTIFAAPNPPSGSAINQTAWACSNANVSVEKYGGTGCKVKVLSYFTGTAEVRCDYYYYWYDKNGFMHTNNATTYYHVTCNPVNLNVTPTRIELNVGEGQRITYTYSPSNVSPKPTIRFISNDTRVASVNSDGYVRAIGSGSTYIQIENSSGPNEKCYVVVKSVNPTSVSLPSVAAIDIDEEKALTASLSPAGAASELTWWSEDNNVVQVSASGIIRGVTKGSTNVWVKTNIGGYTAKCNVTVNEPYLSFVSSTPKDKESSVETDKQLSVSFSLPVYKGPNFDEISLVTRNEQKVIDGTAKIEGKNIVFTPSEELESNTDYIFTLPSMAVQNKWGSPYKKDILINFKTAIGKNDVKWLVLHMGVDFIFPLSDHPKITYGKEGAVFQCEYANNKKELINIGSHKYTLESDSGIPSSIETINKKDANGNIQSDGFYIRISDFKSNVPVYIYSNSGTLVKRVYTNNEGVCLVQTSTLLQGVYIVKVRNISKKFIIK